jgi:5-methyltetrahydrofolate corrinoid/iron sulfur protein methyltransferase
MIKIGEKLNSSIPKILKALHTHDEDSIVEMVKSQSEGGADYLDINTALTGDKERQNLEWLIGLTLQHSACGLMIDSPNPDVIASCLHMAAGRAVIINSVSLDDKYDELIRIAGELGAGFVCLPISGKKIPKTAGERFENAARLIEKMKAFGIEEKMLYIDVLVEALATDDQAGLTALETIKRMRDGFPGVNTICGLSNISFGLPGRERINAAFLTMAMECGLRSAILDITSPAIREALYTGNALLGRDEYCLDYIGYYRSSL